MSIFRPPAARVILDGRSEGNAIRVRKRPSGSLTGGGWGPWTELHGYVRVWLRHTGTSCTPEPVNRFETSGGGNYRRASSDVVGESVVGFGGLIQAAVGSWGGRGAWRTKRSG